MEAAQFPGIFAGLLQHVATGRVGLTHEGWVVSTAKRWKGGRVQDAEPHHTLLWFLREKMGLTGVPELLGGSRTCLNTTVSEGNHMNIK